MSIPEAIKGAQAELARVHSPLQRVQRLATYARIFAAEIFGTVLAVPFGLRALSLHRSLPDARTAAGRAGSVSILRDVRYGSRPRNNMDIYLPPNIQLPDSSQLLQPGAADGDYRLDDAAHSCAGGSSSGSGTSTAGDQATTAGATAGTAPCGVTGSPGSSSSEGSGTMGAPVVLFCHGGVWAAGSAWHYAPLATRLAQAGVVTAVMQYSLYPQALVGQMVAEVSQALSWTMDNAGRLGGSPQKVSLVGHSAGAHMCTMALLHRALAASKAAEGGGSNGHTAPGGSAGGRPEQAAAAVAAVGQQQQQAQQVQGAAAVMGAGEEAAAYADHRMPQRLVGMAGVYDIAKHYEYEEARHVHKLSTMERAVGGNHLFPAFSPAAILANALRRKQQQVEVQHSSWEVLAADPGELLREAGANASKSGARGGIGGNATSVASATTTTATAPAAGPSRALTQPAAEAARAAQQELAAVAREAPPAVAAAPYYQSFELAGEAISRRIGFDRVAAAEAAAAEAATEAAATAGGHPQTIHDAPAAARAVPAAASPLPEALVEPAALSAAAVAAGGSSDPWRIFDVTVEVARRLPPTILTSSCTDLVVPWYESAEMYWMLADCGVPAKHLVYNKVSHGDFVTQWAALPRISESPAGSEEDLEPHAADLVKILSGRASGRYGSGGSAAAAEMAR